jgi:hypothetical protein
MYDEYSRNLIEALPELPDLDPVACRRALSTAYFYIVRSRLLRQDNGAQPEENTDLAETKELLRSMADALESVAVFDPIHDIQRSLEVQNASAFVAAESLALLSELHASNIEEDNQHLLLDALQSSDNYLLLESALLYMVGDFVANAATTIQRVEETPLEADDDQVYRLARGNNAIYVIKRIKDLCLGNVQRPREGNLILLGTDAPPVEYDALLDEIRARFYAQVAQALDSYLDWLGGYSEDGANRTVSLLNQIRAASISRRHPGYSVFADIYHLSSLLLAVINRLGSRALIYNVPSPDTDDTLFIEDFNTYLQYRARGDRSIGRVHQGRPYLWPSTFQFVRECLSGPVRSSVISMPTGSGKSFIAELAIVHALASGSVIYLAPTNALVNQVRRDLTEALRPFRHLPSIRTFIGGAEYTTLTEEQAVLPDYHRFVAVMTPEKCSVALRLSPEKFAHCSLCVFDECHLLDDPQRGMVADVLLAQLSTMAPNTKFVLMSAMVSNPEQLASWLTNISGGKAIPITIKWRPSRAMRGLLVVDNPSCDLGV